MKISSIVNTKYIWLPDMISIAARQRTFRLEDYCTPHGFLVPTSSALGAYHEKLETDGNSDNSTPTQFVLIDKNKMVKQHLGYIVDMRHLCDTYQVYSVGYPDTDFASVADYLFAKGIYKDPKKLILKARKELHINTGYTKYDLDYVLSLCGDKNFTLNFINNQ